MRRKQLDSPEFENQAGGLFFTGSMGVVDIACVFDLSGGNF